MASGSGSATGNPRNKVALLPGHSLMDWIRLGNSGKDLTSVGGRLQSVTEQQLAQHCENGNAWLVIRGKVYNVAPYLNFHPGGAEELMKGAGKDASNLFAEVHPWVNYESILQKCLVGRLVKSNAATQEDIAKAFFAPETPSEPKKSSEKLLNFTWSQTTQSITIHITTNVSSPHVLVRQSTDQSIRILVRVKERLQVFNFCPQKRVVWPCKVSVAVGTGKIDVQFKKEDEGCWDKHGIDSIDQKNALEVEKEMDAYYKAKIEAVTPVTHNVRTMIVRFVDRVVVWVPIGHDIRINAVIEGVETARRYTPIAPQIAPLAPTISPSGPDCLTFMVKCYPSGALTPTLFAKSVGDDVEVGGIGGIFDVCELQGVEQLYLIAAGTGITPMTRLIAWALTNKRVVKTINLLFLNRCEKDIIWRKELDELSLKEPLFKIQYMLSSPPDGWPAWKGRLDDKMLSKFLPGNPNEPKAFACVCGPQDFTLLTQGLLESKGWNSMYHCFLG